MITMQLLWSLFLVGIYVTFLCQAVPVGPGIFDFLSTSQGNVGEESLHLFRNLEIGSDEPKKPIINSDGKLISSKEAENDVENEDFVDEDEDLGESEVQNMLPITHLHRKKGEILVPCFGMWWPVGGVYYDYVGDYYGDYKKKRKSRKQKKKSARMKKKKA